MSSSKDGGERRGGQDRHRLAAMWHPLRQRLARRLLDGEERSAEELAAGLRLAPGRVVYHLRVLARRGVLDVVDDRDSAPTRYRWAADAAWAREMIFAEDEEEGGDE